jgi:hypothetical protein
MATELPEKVIEQIRAQGLPSGGTYAFRPKIKRNRKGELEIDKRAITKGPFCGKKGYVDIENQIWIRDRAHSGLAEHWDVQIDGGAEYFRVDLNGEELR